MVKIKEGVDVNLTAIQKKMLVAITLPMSEDCPTALRYALAKYDASCVSDAWEELYDLAKKGLLIQA